MRPLLHKQKSYLQERFQHSRSWLRCRGRTHAQSKQSDMEVMHKTAAPHKEPSLSCQ